MKVALAVSAGLCSRAGRVANRVLWAYVPV